MEKRLQNLAVYLLLYFYLLLNEGFSSKIKNWFEFSSLVSILLLFVFSIFFFVFKI
jgi:hypothetical protein